MYKVIILSTLLALFFSGCGGSGGSGSSSSSSVKVDQNNSTQNDTSNPVTSYARTVSVKNSNSVNGVAIASSYLKFKNNAPVDEALVPYLQGSSDGKYVDDMLEGSAISFNVQVPDDNVTYGPFAGKIVKYIGVFYYPTILDSNYTNPQTLGGWDVPSIYSQMETTSASTPIFADSATKYPLVVYSHGIGGEMFYAGRQVYDLATNGYAVLGLFHGDHRFDSGVNSPEMTTLRSLSIKKAIDFLQTSKYSTNIDFNKIGALGNSLGGATTFILAGAKPINPKSAMGGVLSNTVSEERIKVAVGIEPFMGDDSGSFPEILGTLVTYFGFGSGGATTVTKPYLAITGTSDSVAVEKYTQAAVKKVPLSSNPHLVSMEGETHKMTPAGENTAKTWGLYFLNYYLKGDTTFLTMKDVQGSPVDTYIPLQ